MNVILLPYGTQIICHQEQVRHIKEVLKSKVGDTLNVGWLGGNLGRATIVKIDSDHIILDEIILDRKPPSKLNLTVVLALPRPKVLRRLIMDMTALGVNQIIIVNSYRTQKSYWQSPLLERIDEFVFEGLQQAIDTVPPTITFQKRFKPFVEDAFPALLADGKGLVAHPYAAQSFKGYLEALKSQKHYTMPEVLCVGAEGGWIDYEVDLLCKQGCQAVSLGERILRTETVVSVLLGAWY